jgi:uncharacterized short protein YbdD (DUF466 family)
MVKKRFLTLFLPISCETAEAVAKFKKLIKLNRDSINYIAHMSRNHFRSIIETSAQDAIKCLSQKCSICMGDFCKASIKDNIVRTECNHFFHQKCIDIWFDSSDDENHKRCPMCRCLLCIW